MAFHAMSQPAGSAVGPENVERFRGASRRRTLVINRPAAEVRSASVIALKNGAVIVPHPFYSDAPQRIEWDIAGFCRNPVPVLQRGEGHMEASSPVAVRSGEA